MNTVALYYQDELEPVVKCVAKLLKSDGYEVQLHNHCKQCFFRTNSSSIKLRKKTEAISNLLYMTCGINFVLVVDKESIPIHLQH
jgi:predicted Zn-ribbon and HTH transcriptional regulator